MRGDTFVSYEKQVYNFQQKLSDLHPVQSRSSKSIDNNANITKMSLKN